MESGRIQVFHLTLCIRVLRVPIIILKVYDLIIITRLKSFDRNPFKGNTNNWNKMRNTIHQFLSSSFFCMDESRDQGALNHLTMN